MKLADWMTPGHRDRFRVLVPPARSSDSRKIVHLESEPDFDTPKNVREAAKAALDQGYTHYGPAAGLPEARKAVAEYLTKTRGVAFDPEEIIITPGGKPIIFFTVLALVNPGDEVIFPDPGFPIYESMIRFVGGKAVPLPIREENDFNFDLKDLESRLSSKTKLLILNSPANPTGGFMEREDLERIAALLKKYPDVMVLSDEIYSRILYTGKHHSIAEFPGMKARTIILDGFSKTFAMTGWRMGYAAAPKTLITAMARLATNCHSCTASFSQIAGIEALTGPQKDVEDMVTQFRLRRDAIVAGLNKLPASLSHAQGRLLRVSNIKGHRQRLQGLADLLLNKAGVACLSGTAFRRGEGYLRFSYANSIENIQLALAKIEETLSAVPQ